MIVQQVTRRYKCSKHDVDKMCITRVQPPATLRTSRQRLDEQAWDIRHELSKDFGCDDFVETKVINLEVEIQ